MKKRGLMFLAGLFLLSLAVVLTGCGGSSNSGTGGTTTYTAGGTVTGLPSGESLVLQDNGGDDLTVTANGSFTFATALADGSDYNVQVSQQPSGATCTASSNSGTISGANVTNVKVNCSVNTYTIGGTVSGLNGTVVLQDNGGDDLTVTANGSFTFATALADGSDYNVQVSQQPSGATCTASSNSGTVSGANVTDVQVTCSTTSYAVGGNVSGLPSGESLVLQDNGGDDLTVTANSFTFATAIADGAGYNVTVKTQPRTATCTASSNSGTVSGGDVTNVIVTCTSVTISGTVTDSNTDARLEGIVISARNPSDDSVIDSATTDASGVYSVTVPANRDFYLHATGATINGTTYVSDNYQIENEAADRTVNFWLVDDATVNSVAGGLGIDTTNDAIFAMGVVDSSAGVADVTVTASPAVSNIWYHQPDDTFLTTGSTTTAGEPSVIGNVSSPGANGTYTFTLSPDQATAGYTIDTTFKLRLIPGELSEAIEP